jgi:hypothetical protein
VALIVAPINESHAGNLMRVLINLTAPPALLIPEHVYGLTTNGRKKLVALFIRQHGHLYNKFQPNFLAVQIIQNGI